MAFYLSIGRQIFAYISQKSDAKMEEQSPIRRFRRLKEMKGERVEIEKV